MKVNEYLVKLEDSLMVGSGRWVADFNESFWEYPMGDFVFDMFVAAKMRPKGFFLSRVASWLLMPNYHVVCLAYSKDYELKHLHDVLTTVSGFLQEEEYAWAWLVVPHEGPFSSKARAMVERNDSREIGIALVDLNSEEIVHSSSYSGRRMPRFIRCFK